MYHGRLEIWRTMLFLRPGPLETAEAVYITVIISMTATKAPMA